MLHKDTIRHIRIDTPAYVLWVYVKPHLRNKGKQTYMDALQNAARLAVESQITISDIEVEVTYSTTSKRGVRADIDNILKPTLDALKGVVFVDDRQVRSVTATLVDKDAPGLLMIREFWEVYRSLNTADPEVVMITVYSDSRLRDLGGPEVVAEKHKAEALEWLRRIEVQERGTRDLA